jgi:3-oxoacyl-[acyl-carrier protein] reductase
MLDTGLAGRTVWITGASGGIGRALARSFAREGARLVLSAHSQLAALEEFAARELAASAPLCLAVDVRDARACERAAEAALARFGRLDHVVANAGRWPSEPRRLDQLDPARLADTVAINLLGAAHTLRAFAAALARTGPRAADDASPGGASAVAIGSTAGRFGERNHSDYAMAKAGLVGLVLSLKNELVALDPAARVNLIEPGWTATEMARPALQDDGAVTRVVRTMALRQLGRADDVAQAALWLCAPRLSPHVTGQTLTLAGGMEGRLLWNEDQVDAERARARTRHPHT